MKIKACILLSLLCVLIYILELLNPTFMIKNFSLSFETLLQKPWTLITYLFLHDPHQYSHLIYNLFALLLFGYILENIIGTRRFILLYFASGITSGLCGLPFYHSLIGVSGAIFGVIGTLSILRPRLIVWVLGVPMPMIAATVIWALIDLAGVFGSDNVAHIGHLIGLGVGIIYGIFLRPVFGERKERKPKISEEYIKQWEEKWMRK